MFRELPAELVKLTLTFFVRLGFVFKEVGVVGKELVDGFVGYKLGFAGLLEFDGAAIYVEEGVLLGFCGAVGLDGEIFRGFESDWIDVFSVEVDAVLIGFALFSFHLRPFIKRYLW